MIMRNEITISPIEAGIMHCPSLYQSLEKEGSKLIEGTDDGQIVSKTWIRASPMSMKKIHDSIYLEFQIDVNDPVKSETTDRITTSCFLHRNDVIYLKKYLDAYLETSSSNAEPLGLPKPY